MSPGKLAQSPSAPFQVTLQRTVSPLRACSTLCYPTRTTKSRGGSSSSSRCLGSRPRLHHSWSQAKRRRRRRSLCYSYCFEWLLLPFLSVWFHESSETTCLLMEMHTCGCSHCENERGSVRTVESIVFSGIKSLPPTLCSCIVTSLFQFHKINVRLVRSVPGEENQEEEGEKGVGERQQQQQRRRRVQNQEEAPRAHSRQRGQKEKETQETQIAQTQLRQTLN